MYCQVHCKRRSDALSINPQVHVHDSVAQQDGAKSGLVSLKDFVSSSCEYLSLHKDLSIV